MGGNAEQSILCTGSNKLALLHALVASAYLTSPPTGASERSIFFDFAGLFTVNYAYSIGVIINWLACAVFVMQVAVNVLPVPCNTTCTEWKKVAMIEFE